MHHHEVDELALTVCGVIDSDEAQEDPTDAAERALWDRYEVEPETFAKIAQDLLVLAMVAPGSISGKVYQGFAKGGCFIVKREFDSHSTGARP